jgi:hypothetical protein
MASALLPEPGVSRQISPVVTAPAVLMEPRAAPTPPPRPTPAPEPVRATPAPVSNNYTPAPAHSAPWPERGPTVSGLARSGLMPTDPPPELDGSKRRRLVRVLLVGLALGAAVLIWTVVRSQLGGTASPGPADSDSAAPSITAPPTAPTPTVTSTATAVDPGKLNRPLRPTPSAKPWIKSKGGAPQKRPQDGTIEIPDVPGDVPPAP